MEKMLAGTQEKGEEDTESSCSELTKTLDPHLPAPLDPGQRVVEESGMKV